MSEQYPVDIAIDVNRDIRISEESGDAVLTDGYEVVQQTAAIAISTRVKPFIGASITGGNLEDLRSTIERAIREEPLFEDVSQVRIVEINRVDDSVTLELTTNVNETQLITV